MTSLFVSGKTALVTGGSRGIGFMIARGLLSAGASVILSSRKADACDDAVRELSPLGELIACPADLSTEAGCHRLAEGIGDRETRHILVNNAGATWGAPLDDVPGPRLGQGDGPQPRAPSS